MVFNVGDFVQINSLSGRVPYAGCYGKVIERSSEVGLLVEVHHKYGTSVVRYNHSELLPAKSLVG